VVSAVGLIGRWARKPRPKSCSDDRLIYGGLDANTIEPTDHGDPRGMPLPLPTAAGLRGQFEAVMSADDVGYVRR
jgi:hypothetical protein